MPLSYFWPYLGPGSSPTADTVYELAQDFMQMLRHREGQRLDVWLGQVRASHIPELQRFVRSMQREEHFIFSWRSFLV